MPRHTHRHPPAPTSTQHPPAAAAAAAAAALTRCACHLCSGCYTEADGNDYRGTVSVNTNGAECAVWSDHKLNAAYVRSFGASSTWN